MHRINAMYLQDVLKKLHLFVSIRKKARFVLELHALGHQHVKMQLQQD